jgi:hypothetical protein
MGQGSANQGNDEAKALQTHVLSVVIKGGRVAEILVLPGASAQISSVQAST